MLRKGSELEFTVAGRVTAVFGGDVGVARADFEFTVAAFFAGRRSESLPKSCEAAFEPSVLITVKVLMAAVPYLWPAGAWLKFSAGMVGKAVGVAFDDEELSGTSLGSFAA